MDHKHDQMPPWKLFPFAGTVMKNLFSKPDTTGYPYEPAHYPERMRGHVEIRVEDCISCGLCVRSCPPGALQVDRAAGTWTIKPVRLRSVRQLRPGLPQKVPGHRAGIHGPCRSKGQRDLHPPQGPRRHAGGQGRRQAGKRRRQVRLLQPSAPENAPRTPSRWTALPRPGSWTPRPAWAAACAPPPAPKSA